MIAIIISVISVIIACASLYFTSKMPEKLENTILEYEKELDNLLKPINTNIKKAFSNKGTAGATAKQLKVMDRKIAEDLLNNSDPLIQAGLELFPNLKDYIETRPHLLPQLLPRLQALSQIEGFKIEDILAKTPSSSRTSNPNARARLRAEQ